ncbi:MAG: ECF transporter S component [Bacilli bacterium]|nr:ECF transporter S component [Bacilli bacterium]
MKKLINLIIYLILIPFIIFAGIFLYNREMYLLVSIIVVVLAILPFFISFEKKKNNLEKIVLVAAFTAVATLSRIIFNIVPLFYGFNPVAAIIILIGITFGGETGFIVGALTALISNSYISQGAWTPFQMFGWGIVGFTSGLFKNILKKNKIILLIFGIFSGIFYSLFMDVYSTLFIDNAFNLKRYLVIVGISLSTTITYIIANFLFLLLFSYLLLGRLERIITKYEIK